MIYSAQICIPGLHTSLGLFLKFYSMMADECKELDLKIAQRKAESTGYLQGESEFDEFVKKLRSAMEHEEAANKLREDAEQVKEYLAYHITFRGPETEQTNPDNPDPVTHQLMQQAQQLLGRAQQEVR